jgi:phenylpropionate dioxygenase-like ring-hydroxylating dioxygenase large terminal subunit
MTSKEMAMLDEDIRFDWAQSIGRQREVARDMQRQMNELVRTKTTAREAGPMRNDPAAYVDPHWLEAEKREIFRKMPLLAGLTRDIPNPGDKMLFDAVGPSILILRAKDGVVRAYLNICPHRAAKVVTDCAQGSKLMTCPFHGWTFDLEGKLVGFPGKDGFAGIDRDEIGLIKLPVAEWHGLIFVVATPGEDAIDVEAHLGAFGPELAQLGLEHAKPIRKSRLDVEANWKYALDTYGEGYHFSTLHPTSIGLSAMTDVMLYQGFGPHHRLGFPHVSAAEEATKPESEWAEKPYGGIHLLFPNTVFNISTLNRYAADGVAPIVAANKGPDHVFGIYRMFPGATPGTAFTMMATYRTGSIDEDEDIGPWEQFHDFIENVVRTEDYSVSKNGQHNLEHAPEGYRMIYGSNEISLQRFHRQIAKRIGRPID